MVNMGLDVAVVNGLGLGGGGIDKEECSQEDGDGKYDRQG